MPIKLHNLGKPNSLQLIISSAIALTITAGFTNGQQLDPVSKLAITEVMWKSGHPEGDDVTGLGGNAQGDWYELTNFGSDPVDIGGYLMDDDDQLFGNDYAILPSFSIEPNETIIVVRESDPNRSDGFRSAWNLPADFRILGECTSTGGDPFSGLSSGGDELNIYAPTAVDADGVPTGEAPILSITLPAASNAQTPGPGQTLSWDADGNPLGLSIDSSSNMPIAGAYQALHDGSETAGPYAILDVASPGFVTGLDTAPATGVQPTLSRLFPDQLHLNCPVEPADCDGNGDGKCDIADLDQLYAAKGTAGPILDMDKNEVIDKDDIDDWLEAASDSDNAAKANPTDVYTIGDVNLDGSVNSGDLGQLLNNFGSTTVVSWSEGDLDLDGGVNSSDLGSLLNNFGFASPTASTTHAVPEPSTSALLLFSLIGFIALRRRSGIKGC